MTTLHSPITYSFISYFKSFKESSRAPGLTSGLQGSVNVHRGTLLLVPQ